MTCIILYGCNIPVATISGCPTDIPPKQILRDFLNYREVPENVRGQYTIIEGKGEYIEYNALQKIISTRNLMRYKISS